MFDVFVVKRTKNAGGQVVKKNFFQFSGVDGAAVGGKACFKPDKQVFVRADAGSTAQNFLAWMAGEKSAAFSRTFCLERILLHCSFKQPQEMIQKCSFPFRSFETVGGETSLL